MVINEYFENTDFFLKLNFQILDFFYTGIYENSSKIFEILGFIFFENAIKKDLAPRRPQAPFYQPRSERTDLFCGRGPLKRIRIIWPGEARRRPLSERSE